MLCVGFSGCVKQGLLFRGGQAPHSGGLSHCGAGALGRLGSSSCGMWAQQGCGIFRGRHCACAPVLAGTLASLAAAKPLNCILKLTHNSSTLGAERDVAARGAQHNRLESENTGGTGGGASGCVVRGKARHRSPCYTQKPACAVRPEREILTHMLQVSENGFLLLMDWGMRLL